MAMRGYGKSSDSTLLISAERISRYFLLMEHAMRSKQIRGFEI